MSAPKQTSETATLLLAAFAFVAISVLSVIAFITAWGGGTEDDPGNRVLTALVVGAIGALVAIGIGRMERLRVVAWTVSVAVVLALVLNLILGSLWGVRIE